MLKIEIPEKEWFDESKNRFVVVKGGTIQLEHSLVSISKWESKWKKPFLETKELTLEELLDYVACMTITQNVNRDIYTNMSRKNIETIKNYLEDSMTATWFKEGPKKQSGKRVVTSELIYYWMSEFNLPFDVCQKWHLNRLLTLIRVCQEEKSFSSKNTGKPKKMSEKDYRERAALNAARKKRYKTKG